MTIMNNRFPKALQQKTNLSVTTISRHHHSSFPVNPNNTIPAINNSNNINTNAIQAKLNNSHANILKNHHSLQMQQPIFNPINQQHTAVQTKPIPLGKMATNKTQQQIPAHFSPHKTMIPHNKPFTTVQPLMTRTNFRSATSKLKHLRSRFAGGVTSREIHDLDTMLHNYHQLGAPTSEVNVHARLQALDAIHLRTHDWFTRKGYRPHSGNRKGMVRLLNSIQQEHRDLIDTTATQGYHLWTPDRATMGVANRTALDTTWSHLTGAVVGGSININDAPMEDPTMHVADFRRNMLSNFARLMYRPTGRQLVQDIDQHGNAVNISPKHPDSLAMGRRGATAVAQDEVGAYGGGGSAGIVRVEAGTSDTTFKDFDAHNNPIMSPDFLGFGHELIHIHHYQRGQAVRGNYAANHALAAYHDQEEYETIDHGPINENMIRNEFHMPTRFGHTGTPTENLQTNTVFNRQRWRIV